MMSRLGTAVAAAMCFGMCLLCLSCIKNPAEEEGNPVTPSVPSVSLICGEGELWEVDDGVGGGALIFRSGGELSYANKEGNTWYALSDGSTWSVLNGNRLITTSNGYIYDAVYTISGNKLSSEIFKENFIKRSGQNIVFQTKPTPTTCTVTFNPNGGTVSPTSAKTGADGKLASLPTPTREGYTFNWWFTEAAGGAAVTTSTVFSTDAVIYAQWTTAPVTPPSGNTFTDSRDGTTYKKVTIGSQTWMAENLNYDIPGVPSDVCYNNDASYCEKLGRLYSWSNAMNNVSSSSENPSGVQGVCPTGWHLPSVAEWAALINYVGSFAGERLRSKTGWNTSTVVGTDEFGFGALPGGYIEGSNSREAGVRGHWWSATANGATYAYHYYMDYGSRDVYRDYNGIGLLFSVRCVAD